MARFCHLFLTERSSFCHISFFCCLRFPPVWWTSWCLMVLRNGWWCWWQHFFRRQMGDRGKRRAFFLCWKYCSRLSEIKRGLSRLGLWRSTGATTGLPPTVRMFMALIWCRMISAFPFSNLHFCLARVTSCLKNNSLLIEAHYRSCDKPGSEFVWHFSPWTRFYAAVKFRFRVYASLLLYFHTWHSS